MNTDNKAVNDDYEKMWGMFFCSVVSFQYHPGTKEKMSIQDCAEVADEMLFIYAERRAVWRGLQG